MLPSPKCTRWVKYFDVSSSNKFVSNSNASHNLSIVVPLGNEISDDKKLIVIVSILPFTSLDVDVLWGCKVF